MNHGGTESGEAGKLQFVGRMVMSEIWRFGFTDRQRRVLARIVGCSLGWGRESVRFESQAILGLMAGMAESHVSDTITELIELGVVHRVAAAGAGGVELRVLPESRNWFTNSKFRPLVDRDYLARLEDGLRRFNGVEQMELMRREPGLRDALAEHSLDEAKLRTNAGAAVSVDRVTESVITDSVRAGEAYRIGKASGGGGGPAGHVTCDLIASRGSSLITGDLHVTEAERRMGTGGVGSETAKPMAGIIERRKATGLEEANGGGDCRTPRPAGIVESDKTVKRRHGPRWFDAELLGEVRGLCKESDWADRPATETEAYRKGWGAWWTAVVRNNPERVRSALGEYHDAVKGRRIDNAGAWMRDLITNWSGA